jgi:hypothetical protein
LRISVLRSYFNSTLKTVFSGKSENEVFCIRHSSILWGYKLLNVVLNTIIIVFIGIPIHPDSLYEGFKLFRKFNSDSVSSLVFNYGPLGHASGGPVIPGIPSLPGSPVVKTSTSLIWCKFMGYRLIWYLEVLSGSHQ